MLKLYFYTQCRNSDMFQSILIVFRELLYINNVHINKDGLLNTLKFVYEMSADITKFIFGNLELVHKIAV
jgi:hypothetical protein